MIDCKKNAQINAQLQALYEEYTADFLKEWSAAFQEKPPCRINEFGIIDEQRYDTHNGILFIGRETNDWSDKEYADGCLFRSWMGEITRNGLAGHGHISLHPNMWYNVGRWTILLRSPSLKVEELAGMKPEAIHAIGTISFTNINKVRGKSRIGKEYYTLSHSAIVGEVLRREINIIRPKTIVLCGTEGPFHEHVQGFTGNVICMPHPGARKSTAAMLKELKRQMDGFDDLSL